ncbi:MAG TPA: DUF418 domain-containing protein [Acidobacteriota bacterium]|nr:DUF418 domain-containing protein [Acidobacteriota bacterium]
MPDAGPVGTGHEDDRPAVEPERMSRLGPVSSSERIAAIDVLRGVALLGILVINIELFALPNSVIFNPTVAGGFTGLNLFAWKVDTIFFLEKMMAIFSMLFGGGLILMSGRAEASGRPLCGIYYRRILWLLLIGLAHAYLLWFGDVLFSYALCGLLLYPLRRRSARLLIILGVILLVLGMLIRTGAGTINGMLRENAVAAQEAQARGEDLSAQQRAVMNAWEQMRSMFEPPAAVLAEETAARRGSYSQVLAWRIPHTLMMQTQGFVFMVFWRTAGLMLLGMGLMKLGVLSGMRSPRYYLLMIITGYGIGLPLSGYGAGSLIAHGFDIVYRLTSGNHYSYTGSVLVALGHTGVIMLVCQFGFLEGLTWRLAAVGRTALTNYLAQTLICTTIFYGYGLGLFGRIDRFGLWAFVLGVWLVQLWLSPIWLKRFRFGPAEWLWRSLTYGRLQPMRVAHSDPPDTHPEHPL